MKNRSARLSAYVFLILYLFLACRLILFRTPCQGETGNPSFFNEIETGLSKANFIPFRSIYYYVSMQEPLQPCVENLFGNILLFLPFGFLLPLVFRCMNHPARIAVAAFCTSLCFESLQLLFTLGQFDVDDLILNSLGAVLGWGLLARIRMFSIQFSGSVRISGK